MNRTDLARFFGKVRVTPSGCWEWTGARRHSYGAFTTLGRQRPAHVIAYRSFVGPIPDGLQLDHLCLNKSCVCPWHVEPVTQRENLQRFWRSRTTCRNGHPRTPENVRRCRNTDPPRDVDRCVICTRETARRSVRKNRTAKLEMTA